MIGHSRTSSTSSTGKQKRSRPLRKTQYCDSAGRSSSGPIASSISAVSASGGSGASWKSSVMVRIRWLGKLPDGAKQFVLGKRLRHVRVGPLLFAPVLVAARILGGDQDHRDALKLRTAFEFAAHLKSVALRHHHVEQDHARPQAADGFLYATRIVQAYRLIAFVLKEALHQLHLRRGVVNDEHFLQHGRNSPEFSEARRCTSVATFAARNPVVSNLRK